jgi:hypothetical protein
MPDEKAPVRGLLAAVTDAFLLRKTDASLLRR